MPEIKVCTRQYRWLNRCSNARFVLMYGGASSGKSWTIAAWLILERLMQQNGVGLLVLRKTKPAVRRSCYQLFRHWLGELGYLNLVSENKSELKMTFPNGSFVLFDGLDDVEKMKSVEGINYVWVEEATEIGEKDFMQLNLRCRAHNPGGINQIFVTFNPVDPVGNEWLKTMTDQGRISRYGSFEMRCRCFTHLDNELLQEEEHQVIEALADMDPEYDKIYRKGEWATPTSIIYDHWDVVETFPPLDQLDEWGYGLDFGYVNPTALVRVGWRELDLFVDEVLYRTRMHNAELIEFLKDPALIKPQNRRRVKIIADSAEPAYIEELNKAGFQCWPTQKVKGQKGCSFVKTGIDRVKRFHLHITQGSPNVLKEIRSYKWKMDKNERVTDEPVKFMDHAMDAMRYYVGGARPQKVVSEIVADYDIMG